MKIFNIKLLFIFSLLTIVSESVFSQKLSSKSKKAKALYHNAESCYSNDDFKGSEEYLKSAIKKDKNFIEAYILLSEVYYETKDYNKQINYLTKAIKIDSTFYIFNYYNLGVANFNIDNYNMSKLWFNKYLKKSNNENFILKTKKWLQQVDFCEKESKKPYKITPINLGENINSSFSEYWPSVTADNSTLVYTVLLPRDSTKISEKNNKVNIFNFNEDFFSSSKDIQNRWSKRKQLEKPLNTSLNEGALTISPDGQWIFFTACGRKDSKGSCDIYFSKKTVKGWSTPVNLGAPVNSSSWESQPSFSSDGKTLYFVSNRKGGIGNNDIWRAQIIGFNRAGVPIFGKLENMGENINTKENEASPFIHPDNTSLYFSSEGWIGMGKFDIFKSTLINNKAVNKPVNLGNGINTKGNEKGLVISADGSTGYFSSESIKPNYGMRDIYKFDIPKDIKPNPVSYIKGIVRDAVTKKPLKANLQLINTKNENITLNVKSSEHSGEFIICLPMGDTYVFNVSEPGYLFYSDNFTSLKSSIIKPIKLDIYLKPIAVGQNTILNNIFYETNKYLLKPESNIELNKIVDFLNKNKNTNICISGHTDNIGTKEYNQKLSEKRAQQVYNYIISKGINPLQITFKGYGEEKPIDTNDTELGRKKNRRTEMVIIK